MVGLTGSSLNQPLSPGWRSILLTSSGPQVKPRVGELMSYKPHLQCGNGGHPKGKFGVAMRRIRTDAGQWKARHAHLRHTLLLKEAGLCTSFHKIILLEGNVLVLRLGFQLCLKCYHFLSIVFKPFKVQLGSFNDSN